VVLWRVVIKPIIERSEWPCGSKLILNPVLPLLDSVTKKIGRLRPSKIWQPTSASESQKKNADVIDCTDDYRSVLICTINHICVPSASCGSLQVRSASKRPRSECLQGRKPPPLPSNLLRILRLRTPLSAAERAQQPPASAPKFRCQYL
jgi:hypothetical protein